MDTGTVRDLIEGLCFKDELVAFVDKRMCGAAPGTRFAVTGITLGIAIAVSMSQGFRNGELAPNVNIVEVHRGLSGFTPRSRRDSAISLCLKVKPSWSGERIAAAFGMRQLKMLRCQ